MLLGAFASQHGVVAISRRRLPTHSSRFRVIQRNGTHHRPGKLGNIGWPITLVVPQRFACKVPRRPGIAGARSPVIMWFRNDLRLDCNDALVSANRNASAVLPVYCFDPREYNICTSITTNTTSTRNTTTKNATASAGFERTGAYRARFLIQSVADLRQRLQAQGSDLVVRVGPPEEVLPALVARVGAARVVCHAEVGVEDVRSEERVRGGLEGLGSGVELVTCWGSTLHHPEDLPFAVQDVPTSYGTFKEVMQSVKIRPADDPPEDLKPWPMGSHIDAGPLPTLEQLGVQGGMLSDPHAVANKLRGGESEAIQRLTTFLHNALNPTTPSSSSSSSHTTANGGGGAGFSCEIAPWLSCGCISPRRVYQQLCEKLGSHCGKGGGVAGGGGGAPAHRGQWMQGELLWRDFFRFITFKYTAAMQTAGAHTHTHPVPA